MKISKGQWKYRLPDAICELRNVMMKDPKGFWLAISQIAAAQVRAYQEDYEDKPIPKMFENRIFVALSHDEIGVQLLIFPTPADDYELNVQAMQVVIL